MLTRNDYRSIICSDSRTVQRLACSQYRTFWSHPKLLYYNFLLYFTDIFLISTCYKQMISIKISFSVDFIFQLWQVQIILLAHSFADPNLITLLLVKDYSLILSVYIKPFLFLCSSTKVTNSILSISHVLLLPGDEIQQSETNAEILLLSFKRNSQLKSQVPLSCV